VDFIALDYETANADQSSICQIGIAKVRNSIVSETKSWLVNPQASFDPINVSIHGIDAYDVKDAPTLKSNLPSLLENLSGKVVISHSAFDRVATFRACEKYNLGAPDSIWMDSARMVRRAWPDHFAKTGYGLKNVAKILGIDFAHHDAGEDARACAEIVIRAVVETGLDLDAWLKRVNQPILPPIGQITTPNSDGPFFGVNIVFTGALEMPRREATSLAASLGFSVDKGVTKKTNILIVGDQDAQKLAGKDKSSKHIKAEKLITNGQHIDIFSESDFRAFFSIAAQQDGS
jgi:DNA polymerase-3 subunit epsilon